MIDELAETMSRPPRARDAGPVPEGRLLIVHPTALVARANVGDGALVLGRMSGSGHLTLDHATVSRQHARVARAGQGHVLEDLGSRNGTGLNGTLLAPHAPHALADNDVVMVGDVVLVYERGVAPAPAHAVREDAIPGEALQTRLLRARIQQAASDPGPVLLLGATGVGKEFAARELHRLSARRGPLIAANVAELTGELVESQLFGHEKGAFTGADRAQPGLFRAADGGTLFLDEIGELPLELQPKLLRVLQEGEVRPVGATRAIKVDVRVLAATHRDLPAWVEAERFRRDLYARLAVWEIPVPSLSARRADIVGWFERLYRGFLERRGLASSGAPSVEAHAVERLLLDPWRENLRGLDRVVHRVAHDLASGEVLSRAALEAHLPTFAPPPKAGAPAPRAAASPASPVSFVPPVPSGPKPPAPTSADELARALAEHGSVRALAKFYARDRRQIYRWLDQFGLKES